MDLLERYRGAMLGLAAGDALGTTNEFHPPGTFTPIEDMVGGGFHGLLPGFWTDDTSMALCLASSLVECQTFDPLDQMQRYVKWWRHGYMSSTGTCFDIGNTIRAALQKFSRSRDPIAGSSNPRSAGNGSLMRLAPVPLFYLGDPFKAVNYAAESSRTTHSAQEAVDACRYFAGLIIGALEGVTKDELLSTSFSPVAGMWEQEPLSPKIAEIAEGSFKTKDTSEIIGGGYVVHCLEAALWAFFRCNNFRDGALLAVNLGYDADTTGAVFGQLAGTYYGEDGIPPSWKKVLALRETIEELAELLFENAGKDYI